MCTGQTVQEVQKAGQKDELEKQFTPTKRNQLQIKPPKMKTATKQGQLIIAFDILNENGESILWKDYINGSKKLIEIQDIDIVDIGMVRTQVGELVRELAEFLSPNEDHLQYKDIDAMGLDEKAYIDAIHERLIPRVQCQITEMDNSQNGLPPKPTSLKKWREISGAWSSNSYTR
jgi:hypothetical protein